MSMTSYLLNRVRSYFYAVLQQLNSRWSKAKASGRLLVRDCAGQGTTEYAILVGVLVLMAIVAVTAFRGRLQELWTSISDGINSL